MEPLALTGNYKLAAAIVIGLLVGCWLIRSDLAWREKVQESFLLKNGLWLKTFLFAIAIGTLIFYCGKWAGIERLNVRPAYLWGAVTGGIIAGIGIAVCGKIPVTAVASLACGRIFSFWVILGFITAFPVVKLISGMLSKTIYNWTQPIGNERVFNNFASLNFAMIWTVSVCLLLTVFLQYTLGSGKKQ